MRLSRIQVVNEEGSVLIVALMILVFLTSIGISATTTTEIELQIAGNEAFHKMAFYHADSGVYSTPKLISTTINDGAQPTVTGITYLDTGTGFYREVMGYMGYDTARDIQFALDGHKVQVDVERTRLEPLVGGGAEFGSGAEGIGVGSAGGIAIYYTLDSLGEGPAGSQATILAEYRLIPGIPGGL